MSQVRALVLAGALAVFSPIPADAAVVAVRFHESLSYGLPVLKSGDRELAHGESVQTVKGDRVDTHLVFRFKDGSLHDESVAYSQAKVFTLQSYRLVQRGPSFPKSTDVSFERASGRYKATVGGETAEGRMDFPPDLHNGMTGTLLRNLPPGGSALGHIVTFTPKPRVLNTELKPEGEERFFVGDEARKATRYLVKLEIGGLTGVVAAAMGKAPPDLRYWIAGGPVPAFLKFEGPMFLNGPVWHIQLGGPRWSK